MLKSDLSAMQAQIDGNTHDINTLFNLTNQNSEAIKKANEGVAMALALESPTLQPDQKIGIAGGIGYYENQGAATMAISARVSPNASISAGMGFGFNSGSVGARGGFQIGW